VKSVKITYKVNSEYINELFDSLIKESKGVSSIQAKAYKKMYFLRVRALYSAMTKNKKVKAYITYQDGDLTEMIQSGDDEFITALYNKWCKFLKSKKKSLEEYPEYKVASSDIMFRKGLQLIKKLKRKLGNTILPDHTVEEYLLNIGITVSQEIYKND